MEHKQLATFACLGAGPYDHCLDLVSACGCHDGRQPWRATGCGGGGVRFERSEVADSAVSSSRLYKQQQKAGSIQHSTMTRSEVNSLARCNSDSTLGIFTELR